jgi:tetratricopeptide (TPR) repeat protein
MPRRRSTSGTCFGCREDSRSRGGLPGCNPSQSSFAEAWYNLADLLDDQGRSQAAVECLRKALVVAPDYIDAIFNLARLLQRKGSYAEAADYWRRYLMSDPASEWPARARRSLKFCEIQINLLGHRPGRKPTLAKLLDACADFRVNALPGLRDRTRKYATLHVMAHSGYAAKTK